MIRCVPGCRVLADDPARHADVCLRLRIDAVSGFPGLVQLGVYSIAGLVAAAAVTRHVLPHLHPRLIAVRDLSGVGASLACAARTAPRLRWPLVALMLGAIAVLALHRGRLWSHELSALSPVPAASQALDAKLRADVGAPDVRYLIVVSGTSEQRYWKARKKSLPDCNRSSIPA